MYFYQNNIMRFLKNLHLPSNYADYIFLLLLLLLLLLFLQNSPL